MDRKSSPTRSVERALEILDCFLDEDEMILLEISEKTGLSPSTALRILSALQDHGFIVRDSRSKKYRLGSKIAWLADRIPRESHEELRKTAYPFMLAAGEKFNEDVRLFVPEGNTKLCIEVVESRRDLRQTLRTGTRRNLVRGAAGKVLLAYMSAADRRRLVTDERLLAELGKIRSQGYAVSDGEREKGLFGLAVPVLGEENRLVGAVAMSGPAERFNNEELPRKIETMLYAGSQISEAWRTRQRRGISEPGEE